MNKNNNIVSFLESYDCQTDEIKLYKRAKVDGNIIEEQIYHYGESFTQERCMIILINIIMELQEKTFEMNNEELKKYLIKEIGITEKEWLVIEPQLRA